jgi:hypothetical protein
VQLIDHLRVQIKQTPQQADAINQHLAQILEYLDAIGCAGGYQKDGIPLLFANFMFLPEPESETLDCLAQTIEPEKISLLRKCLENPNDPLALQKVCDHLNYQDLNPATAALFRVHNDPVRIQGMLNRVFQGWDRKAIDTAESTAYQKTTLLILGLTCLLIVPGIISLFFCKRIFNNFFNHSYNELTKDWKVTMTADEYHRTKALKTQLKVHKPGYLHFHGEEAALEEGHAGAQHDSAFSLFSHRHRTLKTIVVHPHPQVQPQAQPQGAKVSDSVTLYVAGETKASIWRDAHAKVLSEGDVATRPYQENDGIVATQWQQLREEEAQALSKRSLNRFSS